MICKHFLHITQAINLFVILNFHLYSILVGVHSKLGVQNLLRSQTGSQSKPIRGSVKTYPGPVKTLPGPVKTLPGPIKTLPGQVKTLPGMVKTYPVSVYLASYWFTLIKRLFKSIVQCS